MSVQIPSATITAGTGLLALGSTAAAAAAGSIGLWSLALLLSASCAGLVVLLSFFWRLRQDAGQGLATPTVESIGAGRERTPLPTIEPPRHAVKNVTPPATRKPRAKADALPA